jgi:hypothetical protein
MASAQSRLFGVLFVSGLLGVGLAACTSDGGSTATPGSGGTGSGGVSPGSGGTGGTGSGGVSGTGGTTSSGGTATGGTTASTGGQSGSTSSGSGGEAGSSGTGGTTSSGGKATGGSAGAGTGGAAGGGAGGGSTAQGGDAGTGGRMGSGGRTGGQGGAAGGTGTGGRTGGQGGAAGGTGTGGSTAGQGGAAGSTGAGGGGGCVKGGFKGSDLVIFGESFYDWQPPYIKQRMEENARKAGSLGASDSYRQYAVAGQNMSYIANTEYNNAVKAGKFTKVVMDGGGIDCMSSSCPTCPDTFKGMLDKLVTQGVDQLIYTRYPEPGNPPGSNASLKGNLDILMPKMETVCKGYTGLKCYWVDLRPLWPAEKDKYTTDGLHPTKTGGDVVGDAIWAEMVKQCMAQ